MLLNYMKAWFSCAAALLVACGSAYAAEYQDFVVEGGIAGAGRVEVLVVNAQGEVLDGTTLFAKENQIEGTLPLPLNEKVEIRLEAFDTADRILASGTGFAKFVDLRSGSTTIEAVTKSKSKRGALTIAPLKLIMDAETVDEMTQRFYLSAFDAYGKQAELSADDVQWDIPFPTGGVFTPCKSGNTGIACVEVNVPVRLNPVLVACVRDLICRTSLQDVPTPSGYRAIAAGLDHTCALTVDGRLLCFGNNASGQLGRSTTKTCRLSNVPNLPGSFPCDPTPAEVACASGQSCQFVTMDAGANHTCAIDNNKNVFCWGDNSREQLGFRCATGATNPNCYSTSVPTRVNFPSTPGDLFPKFVQVSTGHNHSCAVSERGNTFCWGENQYSQLSQPNGYSSSGAPRRVTSQEFYVQVAAGRDHSCAVTLNGELDCWGGNNQAQIRPISLINNAIFENPVPVRGYHPALTGKITQVTASDLHTCAQADQSGTVCWGGSQAGDVVVSSSAATDISLGHFNAVYGTPACAITGGEVRCAAALNMLTSIAGAPTPLIDVAAGTSHMCAVRDNGEAFCWGPDNTAGQMGDGTTAPHAIPARVLGP